jgi:glycosyltransferase involved in cell wall biosynthesis
MSSADRRAEPNASAVELTVLMPGLNEELNVERAVGRVLAALDTLPFPSEVLVIDDGSTDRTGELARAIAARDSRVRVLQNETNVNYGVSLLRGFAAARGTWVGHVGMDLPLAPEDFALFSARFADSDVVVARRLDRSAHAPWRKVTSWTNRLLLCLLFAPRTADLNFTQFYRRAWLARVRPISTSPAFLTPELILRAERTAQRVREIEVPFQKREAGQAHFGRLPDILWTLKDMVRLRVSTWLRGWEA